MLIILNKHDNFERAIITKEFLKAAVGSIATTKTSFQTLLIMS